MCLGGLSFRIEINFKYACGLDYIYFEKVSLVLTDACYQFNSSLRTLDKLGSGLLEDFL